LVDKARGGTLAQQSEAAAEAMKHDGVLPETMVILVEG